MPHKILSHSTVGMPHDKWVELRKKSLGGSDVAAILGLNPYATPFSVWAEKTGRTPEKPDNETMRQGRDLEGYVVQRFEEKTGFKCRRRNAILQNTAYPFAHANIDRWISSTEGGLECKTTSILNTKKFKNGEYPDTYYVQCVYYMAVTGAPRWHLAVLVLNQGFYTYVIERDQAEIDALMKSAEEFWRLIQNDTPPPVDGLEATTDALNSMYANSNANAPTISILGHDLDASRYLAIKTQIKELESEKEKLEQIFKTKLGDAESGECGIYEVKWKPRTKVTFDTKLFADGNPNINLSPYYKTTNYRQFELKERK